MNRPAWYARLGTPGKRLTLGERYYERALFHYSKNRLDLAVADLDEAIANEPKKAEYYAARGLMLLQAHRPEEAEEDFAFALARDQTQWLVHYGRGMHAFDEEDYAKAVDYFSRAQRVAPERPEIYFYRAVAFHQLKQSEDAARDMEIAQKLLASNDKRARLITKWLAIFKEQKA